MSDEHAKHAHAKGWRLDYSIHETEGDDVRLSVAWPESDGRALYVTPEEYPADEFRIFLSPRQMLRLAWLLIVGSLSRKREPEPWLAAVPVDNDDLPF